MLLTLKSLALGAALLSSQLVFADIPSDIPVSQLLKEATTHLAAGRSQDALSYFDAAIARDPSNYLTVFKRGAAYLSLGRSAQAQRDFDTVLKLKPGFEGALIQRAKIRTRNGDWDLAKEDWTATGRNKESQEVAELEEAQAAVILAEEAEKEGKWEECISQSGVAIRVAPSVLRLRELRSKCRFQNGEIASALSDLQHVLSINSGVTEPHLQVSAMSFYALGETDKGLAQIRKCLQSDPDNKACRKLMRTEKVLDKKLKKLNALWEKRSFASATRMLIKSSEEQGLIEDAKEDFEELKKDGIIHEKATNGLYIDLIEKACEAYVELKKYPKAKAFCEQALQSNPTSLHGLLSKAKQQLDTEEYEAATRTLKEAQEAQHQSNLLNEMVNEANMLLRRSKQKDYYKVLGVQRDADERDIKRAYRKLTKEFHPDKASTHGIPKEEAEKKMAAINEAYETLSDPELRARVDRGDDPNDPAQGQGQPFHGSPFGFGHGGQQFVFRSGPGGQGSPFGGDGGFQFQFPGGFGGFP